MASFVTNALSFFILCICFLSSIQFISSLSTIAISETSNQTLICALNQQSFLNCTSFPDSAIKIDPHPTTTPFSGIVGGDGFLCALNSPPTSSESIVVCWRFSENGTNMTYKRIYSGPTITEFDAGNSRFCGVVQGTSRLECWPWRRFQSNQSLSFSKITVGENVVYGISETGKIIHTGSNETGMIGTEPKGNYSFVSAGFTHACAISFDGSLDCWGKMVGQKPNGRFTTLAMAENRSCALRLNGTVVCWGVNDFSLPKILENTYFIEIEAKRSIFCGVLTSNFSLVCWGSPIFNSKLLVMDNILPGPCRSHCPCSPLPNSFQFCTHGYICKYCEGETNTTTPTPPPKPEERSSGSPLNRKSVAFLVIGCVGLTALILVFSFFLFRYCKDRVCRVHDSGRLDEAGTGTQMGGDNAQSQPTTRALARRLSQLVSFGNGGRLEDFPLEIIRKVTGNFSEDHKIGTGSFGSVYRAKLEDGREVAIKRAETSANTSNTLVAKRQAEKDHAFLNELESLSRINHKNLVSLLGFCEEAGELILIYDYVQNGTLHDHLHKLQSSPLTSWPIRIRVALDAARGIQYLHDYAVPPIIHRDIKSSNILLDSDWTAKLSDLGLSLMGPGDDMSHLSLRAAGTIGYMDPEYYRLQKLTTKSDVYSFGIVLLELLSGHKAILKRRNAPPRNVVDVVLPYIERDDLHRVLDPRVAKPSLFEIEAVKFVGYIASDCVLPDGHRRPSMAQIVGRLEMALAACLAPVMLSRSSTESSDPPSPRSLTCDGRFGKNKYDFLSDMADLNDELSSFEKLVLYSNPEAVCAMV